MQNSARCFSKSGYDKKENSLPFRFNTQRVKQLSPINNLVSFADDEFIEGDKKFVSDYTAISLADTSRLRK